MWIASESKKREQNQSQVLSEYLVHVLSHAFTKMAMAIVWAKPPRVYKYKHRNIYQPRKLYDSHQLKNNKEKIFSTNY